MVRKTLLISGILSSLWYVTITAVVAMQWPAYSSASQTISELSAIGAPTRQLWVRLALPYTLLVVTFGCGVWQSSSGRRRLRVIGAALVAQGVIGLAWPPMHPRDVLASGGGTLTDTMHLLFALVTVLLMLLAMGFGAAALGRKFRRYTLVSMGVLVVFGALTGVDAPRIQANLPTPWAGVWERVNIAVFMLWVIVLAVRLLRAREDETSETGGESDSAAVRMGGSNAHSRSRTPL